MHAHACMAGACPVRVLQVAQCHRTHAASCFHPLRIPRLLLQQPRLARTTRLVASVVVPPSASATVSESVQVLEPVAFTMGMSLPTSPVVIDTGLPVLVMLLASGHLSCGREPDGRA